MGGKSSPPPAPDYTGAAQAQAGASKEITNMQTWANRPTINTPFGSQTWGAGSTVDPATGQLVTNWTQNTTLAPGLQSALESQIGMQNDRSQLAGDFMGRVRSEYGTPFDWNGLPQMARMNGPGTLNTQLADYTPGLRTGVDSMSGGLQTGFSFAGPQRSLNTGDNPALPQFDSGYRDQVANALMTRMQPVHERQQSQIETQLANQGFRVGTEGYTRALADMQQRQAAERYNALDTAGQEAQRLYNMQMGSRQQAFNEDLSAGQFGNQAQNQLYQQMMGQANLNNQAIGQGFGQNLQAAQFGNQALGQASALDQSRFGAMNNALSQQQGLNMQYVNMQNALRQQAIAEQMQRRGMSLNEMNALITGQQVGMPQMPSFNQAQRSETPNYLGAAQMGYDAQLGAYNAQQAGANNFMGGLFSMGASALANPFMFSDRRLKSKIKRVGTHAIGVGIYEYTMMGMSQRGVIAQEVEVVRPDLVKRHASGYLMVNYGGL